MIWRMLAPVLLLSLIFVPEGSAKTSDVGNNYGSGILEIRSQAVGQSLRLTLPMLIPGDISKGSRAYVGMTWTNVWSNDSEFLLDYEMLDTLVGFGYGFNNNFGVGAFLDNRSYFGGLMDDFIEGFHNMFGIDQDGRDKAPSGRSVIQLKDPETGEVTAEIPADKLDNTGLSILANYNFYFENPQLPSMNVYGVARHTLQSPKVFEKTANLDYGLGLGLSKRWFERWYTHAVVGYTWYADRGRIEPGNVTFEDEQLTVLLALGWQYTPDFALLAQYLYGSAVINKFEELDKPSHEVHLGFRWKVNKTYMLDFALIENIITMDNSPDFGLHLGLNASF